MLATRREFVCGAARTLAAAGVVGVTGPLLASCHHARPQTTAAAATAHSTAVDVRPLAADADWLLAPWTGPDAAPVLIVRQSQTQYVALSMQCTHMGCPVNPPVQGVMTCPCHGSQFDLAGNVRRGPAQYPLGRYDTTYDAKAGRLTVALR